MKDNIYKNNKNDLDTNEECKICEHRNNCKQSDVVFILERTIDDAHYGTIYISGDKGIEKIENERLESSELKNDWYKVKSLDELAGTIPPVELGKMRLEDAK